MYHVVLWDNGIVRDLWSAASPNAYPRTVVVNDAGDVAGAIGEESFIWTREGGMIDVGTGPHGFTGAWVVGVSFHGDIVGYTGPCSTQWGQTCGVSGDVRAVPWRRAR